MNTTVSSIIDDELKKNAELTLNAIGLDMSTYLRMALVVLTQEGRIPFEVKLNESEIIKNHEIINYDKWFRNQVQISIDDPRPNFSDDEVKKNAITRHARLQGLIK